MATFEMFPPPLRIKPQLRETVMAITAGIQEGRSRRGREWPRTAGIKQCHNIEDFRSMARRRLPGPIFHYIDGAADDEVTYRRNTEAYERCDLVPNVLAGVEGIDMSITVMGQKLDMPLFCSRRRFSGCSIMTVNGRLPKLPRSSAPCSGFRPWGR
jgi:hypothetical protein